MTDNADNPDAAANLKPFPQTGIVPTTETNAQRFLSEHEDYDGRNVRVAVFDTGVDPGAPGLRLTPDGRPKIVDIVDATGSGDVDTSTVRRASADGEIDGLTGRRLKLAPTWTNPSGEYHVGIKRAYELLPPSVVDRLKRERKKVFDEKQRVAAAALRGELLVAKDSKADDKQKTVKELESRLDALQDGGKAAEDPGPVYDCVVFHDGSVWRCAVDTTESGDLTQVPLLADYRLEHQYSTFSDEDLNNFSVNIYNDGNVLSIVCTAGSHGTHVAGIVGAYYPDNPELNGVAPGCQIIAVKIGDSRLGSMETGAGLIRGLIAAKAAGADLINLSYGESTSNCDIGRIIDLASEIVNQDQIIFVSSAGNNGPALTTVGAPGGTARALIGVGAAVSPAMMAVEYSMRELLPETQYTWSSRGPAQTGDMGVSITAPGGAIAPVPNWTLRGQQLMNGTSMSSPNACGCIALLLSGLKSLGIKYSPHRVRRAVENTARPIAGVEPWAQGHGMIQVDRAFDYLVRFANLDDQDVQLRVSLPSLGDAAGVYLREPDQTDRVLSTNVAVTPTFNDDRSVHPNREKVDFQLRINITSTVPWIEAPDHLLLYSGGRQFGIKVDPRKLDRDTAHLGFVIGTDANNLVRGPLFRVPVTVIRPRLIKPDEEAATVTAIDAVRSRPGSLNRRFLAVPPSATWANVTIQRHDDSGGVEQDTVVLILHTVQLRPQTAFSGLETHQARMFRPGESFTHTIDVEGGTTVEMCLAQSWSSLGDCNVSLKVEFHGISLSPQQVTLHATNQAATMHIRTGPRRELVLPAAWIDAWQHVIRPTGSRIFPLWAPRDLLSRGRRIYGLTLEYAFTIEDPGKITPKVPLLHKQLYDSPVEMQFWMLYDSNKCLLASGDVYASAVAVKKGPHVLRIHIRHDQIERLEKLQHLPAVLHRSLPKDKEVTVPVHNTLYGALTGASVAGSTSVLRGSRMGYRLVSPSDDQISKISKDLKPGDVLLGKINFLKPLSNVQEPTDKNKRPASFPITIVVPPAALSKKDLSDPTGIPRIETKRDGEKKDAAPKPADDKPADDKPADDKPADDKPAEDKPAEDKPTEDKPAEDKPAEAPKDDDAKPKKDEKDFATKLAEDIRDLKITALTKQLRPLAKAKERQPLAAELLEAFPEHVPLLVEEMRYYDLLVKDKAEPAADSVLHGVDLAGKATDLAERIIALLDKPDLGQYFGTKHVALDDDAVDDNKKQKKDMEGKKDALVEALALRASILSKASDRADDFEKAYAALCAWVDPATDAKYIEVFVARERARGRPGAALKPLSKVLSSIDTDNSARKRLFELRAGIWGELGWQHLVDNNVRQLLVKYPPYGYAQH